MSNSPLVGYTALSPNHSGRRNHSIDTVSIHCMAGDLSVERCGALFADPARKASSNYGIGSDGRIALYVDEANRSWCSSSSSNDNRAVTIEVASDNKDPYAVTDAAYAALLDLLEDICRRNGKTRLLWFGDKAKTLAYTPKSGEMVMTVHRWFANKACPGNYLFSRHGQIAAEVNARLEGDEMDIEKLTQEQLLRLAERMDEARADQQPAEWSKEARKWAESTGLISGDEHGNKKYKVNVTCERLVQLLYNLVHGVLH